MKQHKSQILAVTVVILLVLLGMLLYYRFADPAKFWFCSPAEPRGNDVEAWQKTITPAQPPEVLDEDFFKNFTVGSDSDYFTVTHPSERALDNSFAFELIEMTPGETLDIGGGTLKLSCIGAAYHDANQTMAEDAKFRLYDPDLRPIADTDLSKFGNYQTTEDGSNFRYNPCPAVQFVFENQGIEDLMFHGIKIFDSQTRKSLTSGYSSSGSNGSFRFNTHPPMWHHTPIDIVIDVSYGPTKTFEFAPRAGQGFDAGSFKCRLLSVFEGIELSRHSSSTLNNTMIHEFPKASSDDAGLCFFFVCLPTASQIPVTFEFLDKDGNKISTRGSSTTGYIHNIFFKQPLEKIALIRAHYRTRRYRIVVHLPYIPGLPEENNTINNLFDVHIPYVRLHDPDQICRIVYQTLQLGQSRSTGPTPAASINNLSFPMDFNNVTIRDIARLYGQGGTLYVDIENDQLNRDYPVPLWVRIKQFVRKMLP